MLWLMERMGPSWWLWAWGVTTAFSLFAAWIYPTVLAPLFNKFTPLPDGELKDAILDLARRTGFRAGGISVMDASRRTAHGNAYFTGVFGQKRIVLFDTLLEAMGPREVVAVLAHELGHFKLHHVRWGMARGIATSGLVFYALSLCLPLEAFYSAFSLEKTAYGALAVFGLWFGLVSFLLQPLENALSRRHEFAADAFALRSGASRGRAGRPRSASSARRADTCPSPTRSTRGSTTRTRRSSSGCGRWGRSRAPEAALQPRRAPRLFLEGAGPRRARGPRGCGSSGRRCGGRSGRRCGCWRGRRAGARSRGAAARARGARPRLPAARRRKATTESCGSSSISNRGSSRSVS